MADYRQDLDAKLQAAQRRAKQGREFRAIKEAAPSLFEVIDLQISKLVNAMTAQEPLEYEDYLSKHGGARSLIDLRNLIDSKEVEAEPAAKEAAGIQEAIEQFDNDQKQK